MPKTSPIVVSMGDPAGIGPEIILKSWSRRRVSGPVFACFGAPAVFDAVAATLDLPPVTPISNLSAAQDVFAEALPVIALPGASDVTPGKPSPEHAPIARASIDNAVAACLNADARALVTAPIAKSVMYAAGFTAPGHTEYLAELTSSAPQDAPRGPVMMLAAQDLRVVLTSVHEPIRQAVNTLNPDRIAGVARLLDHALKRDFGIAQPRLALAGLNPHAGEDGALGREEIEILNPLAIKLRHEGLTITDALPPDTMFHAEARAQYDAAICHYHDQGLIPVKTLDFHGGVNITLGLPIVRTSPDHGTAFNIAGRGVARPDSFLAALDQADQISRHRGA